MIRYFDAHSHIHGKEYDSDRVDVLSRMKEAGVGTITIGTDLETSKQAVALAEAEENVWAAIGIHPTDTADSFWADDFKELGASKRVVAIGECGLDYFRIEGDVQLEKERQIKNFLSQLEFAVSLDKPLMIHCRPSGKTMDAHEDLQALITLKQKEFGEKLRGNIHFFTGTQEIAQKYFELGFSVSFSGVITFAREYDDLIREVPSTMILSETDSPYATPVPHRGKRNEPTYVIETVKRIGEITGKSEESIATELLENAKQIFGLPL